MLKLRKYDPTKTYMFVDGTLATPEIILARNPAIAHFPFVLELNGDVVQAVMALSALREIHKIDPLLSDDDAILALEVITNTPPEVVVSAEERMASAMEFANVLALDTPILTVEPLGESMMMTTESAVLTEGAKLIKRNYDRGLWSLPMLNKAVEKGVLTTAELNTIIGNSNLI